ncbi:probable G-protein coupled receptor B0563.6 [Vespula pensylvanica]|nr:probable G-protein coupled receptor B0563.6 [Vespula pensylvanica]XP_043676101.1 probable G-protein coupled receptor B0563.6 [Vespula pensylvanica]XP_043676102.1 probable G-protein coupled receptor B0563.6 [Vespula pensylvanica]XP_050859194.1 probable G-protein coupled receptor B0563.6 [Vespula vulgaris]XP_050859195.1 probable G-protein coupled receptor B0563.6 [Vespula vulgaris]XP_050859196.1 probable G-protein coupled receptor B0563.6 [Vespula vulgaris]
MEADNLFLDENVNFKVGRKKRKAMETLNVSGGRICFSQEDLEILEDPRTPTLRRISYGIVLPAICCLGIIGNMLNLLVLTRRNMRGTAYIYMRGYSVAALLAILFCIPFALRVFIHKETGRWNNWPQAFYHAHLELFLGNGCLGVGVMMLLALTVERYVSVCHPGQHTRPLCGPPHLTVALIPLATFLVYLPSVFRSEVTTCFLTSEGPLIYQKRENQSFLHSLFYQVYKVVLEIVFKIAPTILLAGFNLRIMVVYRRSCERRRRMTLSRTMSNDEDSRTFAEERRLILLLGSTSILFLVCVSPMVILNVTLSENNLSYFSYQVFRALANLLEVLNYSITFYIYCLFSEDFRNTLMRTLQWPWLKSGQGGRKVPMKRSPLARPTTTTTPPTTAVATPGHLARVSV